MPPGAERAEAMKKATILENAAEMLKHFGANDITVVVPHHATDR